MDKVVFVIVMEDGFKLYWNDTREVWVRNKDQATEFNMADLMPLEETNGILGVGVELETV